MNYFDEALKLAQEIEQLYGEAAQSLQSRRNGADRVLHLWQSDIVFMQGQNNVSDMVFSIPEGIDYEAARLMLFPEVRRIGISGTSFSDAVFRPTAWFGDLPTVNQVASYETAFPNSLVDAQIAISTVQPDGKVQKYQNAPFFVAQTFSSVFAAGFGQPMFGAPFGFNAYPGGLVFEPFLLLPGGSSMSVQVTPTYSGSQQAAAIGDGRLYEYRIRGIIEGYKRERT